MECCDVPAPDGKNDSSLYFAANMSEGTGVFSNFVMTNIEPTPEDFTPDETEHYPVTWGNKRVINGTR